MSSRPAVPESICQRCQKNGHASLLFHYKHGVYCVLCVRDMLGIINDFVEADRTMTLEGKRIKKAPDPAGAVDRPRKGRGA